MTAIVENGAPLLNGSATGGDLGLRFDSTSGNVVVLKHKTKESESRRRRRKQKKGNNKNDPVQADVKDDNEYATDENDQVLEKVEVEYVPETAELDDGLLDDFKKVLERFSFGDATVSAEVDAKKDEAAQISTSRKKDDSDSEEDEQDAQEKEKGISNKKKKLQRRMKIAELKQICSKPDVVEIWDATAADPKLLVFLKSYRNTVPVPRHWCQKRKFLQGGTDHQPCKSWRQYFCYDSLRMWGITLRFPLLLLNV